jgi:hypothetical protein
MPEKHAAQGALRNLIEIDAALRGYCAVNHEPH